MKTPLTYYGGKQQLVKTILALTPPHHTIYTEPFIGGGAVFFAKEPVQVEIINDTNKNLINFYQVCKYQFDKLQPLIMNSLHSRELYRQSRVILDNPDMFDSVRRAWAVWIMSNTAFGSKWYAGFGYDKSGCTTKKIVNKIALFTDQICTRLQHVQIECCDALRIITSRDTPETFFYLDPPYPDTNQGHYNGYSAGDFKELLEVISHIKGKFLLSSFRHPVLREYTEQNGWHILEFKMNKSITARTANHSQKIEVLTANYPLQLEQ